MKLFTILVLFAAMSGPVQSVYAQSSRHFASQDSFRTYILSTLQEAEDIAFEMRDYVNPHTFGDVFQPMQIQAALAADTIEDLGELSEESRQAVGIFVALVESNRNTILSLLRTSVHFNRARTFLSSVRRIKRELR